MKKNQSLVKKINKLAASEAEKQRIYNLMNENLDLASTVALDQYRIKTKDEKTSKEEKKQLQKEIKEYNEKINSNTKNINWIISKIQKRA